MCILAETHHADDFSDRQICFSSPIPPGRTNSEELLDMIESRPANRPGRPTPVFSDSDVDSPDCIPVPLSFTEAANTFLESPPLSSVGTGFVLDFTAAAVAWDSAEDRPNTPPNNAASDHTELDHMAISDLYGMFDADDADGDDFSAPVTQPLLTDLAALFDSDDEKKSDGSVAQDVALAAEDIVVPPFNITDLGGLFVSDDEEDK